MLGFLLVYWEETDFHDLSMKLPALQFQDLILINSSHTNYNWSVPLFFGVSCKTKDILGKNIFLSHTDL